MDIHIFFNTIRLVADVQTIGYHRSNSTETIDISVRKCGQNVAAAALSPPPLDTSAIAHDIQGRKSGQP